MKIGRTATKEEWETIAKHVNTVRANVDDMHTKIHEFAGDRYAEYMYRALKNIDKCRSKLDDYAVACGQDFNGLFYGTKSS